MKRMNYETLQIEVQTMLIENGFALSSGGGLDPLVPEENW